MQFHSALILCFASIFGSAIGSTFRCYSCSFTSVEADRSCLTVTETTPQVECPHRYCTIRRIEFLDPSGVVASFRRGCDERPDYLNHEVTDSNFRTFYRACTSSLCNIGNGIQLVGGQDLSPAPAFTGQNLLVPGTGGSGTQNKPALIIIGALILINIYVTLINY